MTKNNAASVMLGCVSWMIQNRWAVGTNDMVACRTMPSSRANPLTASSACSLSGAGEPSPDLTGGSTPLRPSHAVRGRMVVVLLGSDDRPPRLPRPPLAGGAHPDDAIPCAPGEQARADVGLPAGRRIRSVLPGR